MRYLLLTILLIAGCRVAQLPTAQATTNPVTAPAAAAIEHSTAARAAIVAVKPEVSPAGKPHIEEAERRTIAAIEAERQVQQAADEVGRVISRYEDTLAQERIDHGRAMADAVRERDEAKAKYDGAWLGGRTWRWIRGISFTLGLLTVVGLVLNSKTDFFVYLAGPLHWAFDLLLSAISGAFKMVAQAFGYRGRAGG